MSGHLHDAAATEDAAQLQLRSRVMDDLRRVALAVQAGEIGGRSFPTAIRLPRHSHSGPELILQDGDLDAHELSAALDLAGKDLRVELIDGNLTYSSPTWEPDRIPF